MKFSEIFKSADPILSFEFFPPKDDADLPQTLELMRELRALSPHFMTVTYGAGGSKRGLTDKMVSYIHRELKVTAVQHLTCAGHSIAELDEIIDALEKEGIHNILALRGDPPKGTTTFEPHAEGFNCARDLTRHLRRRKKLSVAVAGYPESHKEAKSPDADLEYLKEKVEAGSEVVITQLFFESDTFFRFVERARKIGISIPIVPGIMPISNLHQLERFTALCGATVPDRVRNDLRKLEGSPADVLAYGTEFAVKQCRELLDGGAPGIHLYTLNRSTQILPIVNALGIGKK